MLCALISRASIQAHNDEEQVPTDSNNVANHKLLQNEGYLCFAKLPKGTFFIARKLSFFPHLFFERNFYQRKRETGDVWYHMKNERRLRKQKGSGKLWPLQQSKGIKSILMRRRLGAENGWCQSLSTRHCRGKLWKIEIETWAGFLIEIEKELQYASLNCSLLITQPRSKDQQQ